MAGCSGINNLKDLVEQVKNEYTILFPDMKKWPCPFCYTKSKDKLQCRIHIAREHPSISRADRSEFTKFCKDFNVGNDVSSRSKENEVPISQSEENSSQGKPGYDTQCEICKQFCKGNKGLAIHTSKKHKTEQRKKIVKLYTKVKESEPVVDTTEAIPETVPVKTEKSEFKLFCDKMEEDLNSLLRNQELEKDKCENLVNVMVLQLKEIQDKLPGPKNPATKFYKIRKSKNFQNVDRTYATSSNPRRKSKRDREKRNQKYNRDWIQWLYYNQRKRAVREISEDKNNVCPIKLSTLHEKFQERWGTPNINVIPQIPIPTSDQENIDAEYIAEITADEMKDAIKKTSSDSAAGPDYIIPRTLKTHSENVSRILSKLATVMLKWNYVPKCFKKARTVLGFKGNDRLDVKNWRPLTVCSILRRIIEKVLDRHLRSYLIVSPTQTGFTNQPGTFINTTILSAALNSAKAKKDTLVVVLLDIRQAYDKIGHAQISMSMNAQPLPSKLRALVLKLDEGNYTQIRTHEGLTKYIDFNCGILQGAPTSPQKFNAATKIVLDELNEHEMLHKYGYKINETLDPITNLAFADDTGILANSRISAAVLVNETLENFKKIGLEINYEKSVAIIIENGKLNSTDLIVNDEISIRALKANETIRYLGVTFADEITFDEEKTIKNLNDKLDKIVSTTTLRPDQKMKIINIYIFPTLTYKFQTAPLSKLKKGFLKNVDKVIRHAVKEILQIPDDTPNNMLYSCNSMKGLSLIRAEWEVYIQNINAIFVLQKSNHPIVNEVRDMDKEIENCLTKLNLPKDFLINTNSNKPSNLLRSELRQREYIQWQRLKSKGKGVVLFQECPKFNRIIYEKHGLTTSEWITYFKMVGNVAPVRVIPGRSSGTSRCRINSCDEIETLPHVLGFCRQGELLRHDRHNKVVRILADEFQKKKWSVIVEFPCVSSDGSNRRVDLIVYDNLTRNGFILDPTVRFESDESQPEAVNEEKQRLYEPCIKDIQIKCKLKELKVVGLLVGARGTIPKFFVDFCKQFKINNSVIENIIIEVLRGSTKILHNHTYDPTRS